MSAVRARSSSTRLPILIAIAVVLALGLVALVIARFRAETALDLRGTQLHGPAPDFTLTDQQGKPFTLSAQRGNVVVLFFGYTHCPDVCPQGLATLANAYRRLTPAQAEHVKVAFITVDPARDTPAVLGKYVALFSPSFTGLTGTEAQLDPVYRDYHIFHQKLPEKNGNYAVAHSGSLFVIDRSGRMRVLHDYNDAPADLAHDLGALAS